MEDSIKCSSHTFSGLLRLTANTVVPQPLVPFSSFFVSPFLSFSPFLLSFIYCYICSYHHGPKHLDKVPTVQGGVGLDQKADDGS